MPLAGFFQDEHLESWSMTVVDEKIASMKWKHGFSPQRTLFDRLPTRRDGVIHSWFMGMNPQLRGESAVETLLEGRAREAVAAARSFVNAG